MARKGRLALAELAYDGRHKLGEELAGALFHRAGRSAGSARGAPYELEFVNGSIYRYEDVGVDVFARLASAESKGAFFNAEIRGRFRFRRAT
ncbi:MAG: KTSC domain-containing protein [Deltaproteobacteria bacterium]